MRVLIAEDDSRVRHWLGAKLQVSGYQCMLVDNGELALKVVNEEAFDIIILDRMLPKMNGLDVLFQLKEKRHPPIIILSALDQPDDRVEGLRAGADDYLGKPFHFTELVARIEVLIRRFNKSFEYGVLQTSDLMMDVVKRTAQRGKVRLDLTEKEFHLLRVLLEHSGQIVTRGMLLQKIWGYEFDPQTNLIDVHMSKLRTKLDKDFEVPLLKTIRSVGYVLG